MPFPWSARRHERTRRAMSTFVTITVEERSRVRAEEAVGRAFDELDRLAACLTRFDGASPVGVLNAQGRLRDPPPELVVVLEAALALHRASGGAFDPTVAPLVDACHVHFAAHGGPPDQRELRELRELVGAHHVRLDGHGVHLGRTGMALTLDGIGKGYVADRVAATLAAHGVRHALVNAGGDLRALGTRADGRPWRVGVQDPRRAERLAAVTELAGSAVATSGDYVRYYDVERRCHHTVVPGSGCSPAQLSSVSVRAAAAIEADALATAAFVLGAEEGLRFIEARAGAECLLLLRDGRRLRSRGW